MLTLRDICEHLSKYHPRMVSENMQIEITGVKLFSKNDKYYENSTLYVCRSSMLNGEIPDANLLVVNDDSLKLHHTCSREAGIIEVDSGEEDFTDLFNEVQDIFIGNAKLIFSSAELMNSLIAGKGLQYIIRIGTKILKKAIILIDASFNILAYSDTRGINEPLWNEYIKKGYCSYEFITEIKKMKTIEKLTKTCEPIIVTCYASDISKMVSKVDVDNRIVGYVVVLEDGQPFNQRDFELAVLLSNVISEEMKKNDTFKNMKGVVYESLLIDLLKGKISREETALERMRNTGCSFEGSMYVLGISMLENRSNYYFVDYIRDRLKELLHHSKSVLYNDYIVLLLEDKEDMFLDHNTMAELENALRENRLVGGFSRQFSNIMKFKDHYEQSIRSIEFGSLFHPGENIYYYENLQIYHLLSLVPSEEQLMDFCHPALLRLIEYDRENNTRYYDTLYQYLKCSGSVIDAAKHLFIHRNTMAYRIGRIAEILGLDLQDSETIFRIFISYKILDYLKHYSAVHPVLDENIH